MYIIKRLSSYNREQVKQHFLRLDKASRYSRFCCSTNDSQIAHYVKNLDFIHNAIFGIFNDDLSIIGVGECVFYDKNIGYSKSAEVAFSVEKPYQGQKLGNKLMQKVVQYANSHNIKNLTMYFLKSNAAIVHLSKKYNFQLEYCASEITGVAKVNNLSPMLHNFSFQIEDFLANIALINACNYNNVNTSMDTWTNNIRKLIK